MAQAFGLYTHIQANRRRSALLLGAFAVLFLVVAYAFALLYEGLRGFGILGQLLHIKPEKDFTVLALRAFDDMRVAAPATLAGVALWFGVAWIVAPSVISAASCSRPLDRNDARVVRDALEALCISRGLPTPDLRIIETDALNAYASGLTRGEATITVTRGLVRALDRDEMEAVLAHELTHIVNRDVMLLTVAVIFVGIFDFFAPKHAAQGADASSTPLYSSRSSSSSDGDGGAGTVAVMAVVFAVLLLIGAGFLAKLARFALSRRREFLADAGAVELTKNPDAMIAALRKIEAHSELPEVNPALAPFFIAAPVALADLYATHPSIDERIKALVAYAGAHAIEAPRRATFATHAPAPAFAAPAFAAAARGAPMPARSFGRRRAS